MIERRAMAIALKQSMTCGDRYLPDQGFFVPYRWLVIGCAN